MHVVDEEMTTDVYGDSIARIISERGWIADTN